MLRTHQAFSETIQAFSETIERSADSQYGLGGFSNSAQSPNKAVICCCPTTPGKLPERCPHIEMKRHQDCCSQNARHSISPRFSQEELPICLLRERQQHCFRRETLSSVNH